jgi:hypothetical protein
VSNPSISSARLESAPTVDARLGSGGAVDGSTVRLQVPLRHEFASTVRVVVASIAADAGFSVDDIDDLRLAVSEVFSSFDTGPDHDSPVVDLSARATVESDRPAVTIQLATSTGGVPTGAIDLDELATTIIRAAVDEFRVDTGVVTLVKRTDRVR